ncbi:MAG: hypothetical protein MJB12_19415 [Firmicutes bacterium]|nr:hypothetical protein [Bacillota bacterium]
MMDRVTKGQNMVIVLIVMVWLRDILAFVYQCLVHVRFEIISEFSQSVFRVILTGLLFFFLYKGRRWAKWLSVVVLFQRGIALLSRLITDFDNNTDLVEILLGLDSVFVNSVYTFIGLAYMFFGVLLTVSGSVNDFFQYQRGEATPNLGKNFRTEDNIR